MVKAWKRQAARLASAFGILGVLLAPLPAFAEGEPALDIPAESCILVAGDTVLYEENADQPMPPASITKIMTLLLTFEALEAGQISLDQTVVCSEHAASMGGTQIWLEPGEEMPLSDII